MEAQVSEILENILGLLALEGGFEVVENESEIQVTIEANDPGRLIGFRGETLDALQLLVNLILIRQNPDQYKRVVIDVEGWRKNKEEDLKKRTQSWIDQVTDNAKELELEPMPSWQRRIIHMVVSENNKVESESVGEGKDRHLIIRPKVTKTTGVKKAKTPKEAKKAKKEVESLEALD